MPDVTDPSEIPVGPVDASGEPDRQDDLPPAPAGQSARQSDEDPPECLRRVLERSNGVLVARRRSASPAHCRRRPRTAPAARSRRSCQVSAPIFSIKLANATLLERAKPSR